MRMESNSKNNTKLGKLKKKQKLLLKTNGKTEQVLKKLKRKLDMAESDEKGNLTEESGNTVDKNVCLEGMTAAEMAMVRKLAGNDPVVRKKTLRKLKKWLGVLAMKVSDGEGNVTQMQSQLNTYMYISGFKTGLNFISLRSLAHCRLQRCYRAQLHSCVEGFVLLYVDGR